MLSTSLCASRPSSVHKGALAIVGEAKEGKSTLLGHLLHLTKPRALVGIQKDFASVVDLTPEERIAKETLKGTLVSLDLPAPSQGQDGGPAAYLMVADLPGSMKQVGNVITVMNLCDFAMFVISKRIPRVSSYIRGLVAVAAAHKMSKILVVVNLKEAMPNEQEHFEEIKSLMTSLLSKTTYPLEQTIFLPVNALAGTNFVARPKEGESLSWFQGGTLLEALASLSAQPPPQALLKDPLRFAVVRTLPPRRLARVPREGTVVIGRVLSGVVRTGMEVLLLPSDIRTRVSEMEMHCTEISEGTCGHWISFYLPNVSRREIPKGTIISDPQNSPATLISSFRAKVVITDATETLRKGRELTLYSHGGHVTCKIARLITTLGAPGRTRENPESLQIGTPGMVEFIPMSGMVLEPANGSHPLEIFFWTRNNVVSGAGRVSEVTKKAVPPPAPRYLPLRASLANLTLSEVDYMTKLSDDCWLQVFSFLDPKSLLRMGMTCRRAYSLSKANFLWKRLAPSFSAGGGVNNPRKYFIDKKMGPWIWHRGHDNTCRILVAGRSKTGKSSLIQALKFFVTHPGRYELSTSQLADLVADAGDVTSLRHKNRRYIFYEVHGSDGRLPRFRREQVDLLLYCVDEATRARHSVYDHFHNLLGTGQGEDLNARVVVTKAEKPIDVRVYSTYMRLDAVARCNYYSSCHAQISQASAYSRTQILALFSHLEEIDTV